MILLLMYTMIILISWNLVTDSTLRAVFIYIYTTLEVEELVMELSGYWTDLTNQLTAHDYLHI